MLDVLRIECDVRPARAPSERLVADLAAADMKVKAPVMKAPPMPVTAWTGCYIGATGGGD
jgi:hypothetical protein